MKPMTRFTQDDKDALRALLIGRTVTKVNDETLRLDNGTVLTIHGNEGCGGCGSGWYEIKELNDSPVNAIMAVEFEVAESADTHTDTYRIFVLAADERIKMLEAEGYDSGYYGAGYWIELTR